MDTKKIKHIPTESEYIASAVISRIPQTAAAQIKKFDPLIEKLTDMLSAVWIKASNKNVWFNTAVSGIFPNLDTFEASRQNIFFSFVESKFKRNFDGFEGTLMSVMELRASGIAKHPSYENCLLAYKEGATVKALDLQSNITYNFNTANHQEAVCIPSIRFTKKSGLPLTVSEMLLVMLDNEIVPEGLTAIETDSYSDLMRLYKADRNYCGISADGKIEFYCATLAADIAEGNFSGSINGLDFSMDTLLAVNHIKADADFTEALKLSLINCEKRRADIDPYDEKLLSDPNRGHWELWNGNHEDFDYAIEITEPLIARNPCTDINHDGVIAIDFGTKSTVVVFQKSSEHTLPMAIGTGKIADTGKAEHYENPTVMEFSDVGSFLEKYNARSGRPETLWETLPVSHCAYSDMKNSASKDYYAYFCDLKQWAGEGNYPVRICDRNGGEYLLPPYMSDEIAEFDPIELYAYYIGLYINNMRNGIYLDYYLSFPVTFEKAVREKIAASFERGIMKSLPAAVLADPEIMADFRVDGSVSEPAAYAICAMEQYGVLPDGEEEFHYGIFDFGGGTADFDFGVCKVSEKRKFDYSIENYGDGGDRYLGGENLLELMAVTVFRDNFDKIAKHEITFTLPNRCSEFAGSAAVVARSKEAEANMRHLMEHLRPLWENTGENRSEFERGIICVDLFDRGGGLIPRFELEISEEKLLGIIRENIASGIDNFFTSMSLAYTSSRATVPDTVNIMLAGNSCRNPMVTELFVEKFEQGAMKLKKALGEKNEFKFVLYPPLGTEEAYSIMELKGLDSHRGSFEYPTGKTGVAFGLIKCRRGGVIERKALSAKADEIPFKYFIGFNKRGKFNVLVDDNAPMVFAGKPDYNVWYNFTDADEDTFEIFYTPLPEAVTNTIPIDKVMKKKCRLNVTYEKACVYVRATGPKTLQYVVATENGIAFETYLNRIATVELDN